MVSPSLEKLLKPAALIHQILWATLTFSLVIYVGVAYAVAEPEAAAPIPSRFTLALAIAACGIAALSFRIPAILLSDDKLRGVLAPEPSPAELARNPQTGQVDAERQREIATLPTHEQRLLRVPGAMLTPLILRLVLNESIGIFGLVLSFVSHRFEPVLPFALAAIVLNLLARPQLGPVLERASRLIR